jgi:hypothetical protein
MSKNKKKLMITLIRTYILDTRHLQNTLCLTLINVSLIYSPRINGFNVTAQINDHPNASDFINRISKLN